MYDVFECEECGEEIGGRHGDDVTCPHCGTVSEPPDPTPMYYDPWRARRYDYAMRCWAIYLRQIDDERRAWYGIR